MRTRQTMLSHLVFDFVPTYFDEFTHCLTDSDMHSDIAAENHKTKPNTNPNRRFLTLSNYGRNYIAVEFNIIILLI